MYAFRKPISAGFWGSEENVVDIGVEITVKSLFVISQVLGYCLSKFIGIKIISEMSPQKRAVAILGCIGMAETALLLFAVVPEPWNALCLFFNGLPLGMVWGLVFGFLEGRKVSEPLGAGLSASYILAGDTIRSVGRALVDSGIPEVWMPFVTGLCFTPLFLFAVYLLKQIPPPSEEDERSRTRREPMDGKARMAFVKKYFFGLFMLTFLYIFLTAYRDIRDNFAPEIWRDLGYGDQPSIMAATALPVTVGVLIVLGLLMLIKDNRKALIVVHWVMLAGAGISGLSTLAFQAGMISPAAWMILNGLGLYVAYVPYGCVLFDRLIAALGAIGTAGFMIYVTDSFGYLGSVVLLIYKDLRQVTVEGPLLHLDTKATEAESSGNWLEFFVSFSYITTAVCVVAFLISSIYFMRQTTAKRTNNADSVQS